MQALAPTQLLLNENEYRRLNFFTGELVFNFMNNRNLSPYPKRPHIAGFDYTSPNFYYVTIVTHHRRCTLATISNDFVLTRRPLGKALKDSVFTSLERFKHIRLDIGVVMPNHAHLLFQFGEAPPKKRIGLWRFMNEIKSRASVSYNKSVDEPGVERWQYGYDERVIRNERHLLAVRGYIQNNPVKWAVDKLNPESLLYRPEDLEG